MNLSLLTVVHVPQITDEDGRRNPVRDVLLKLPGRRSLHVDSLSGTDKAVDDVGGVGEEFDATIERDIEQYGQSDVVHGIRSQCRS